MKEDCSLIEDFLYQNVYNHSKLKDKRNEVTNEIFNLFKYFIM
jgi:hypothetical protein